ncbi:hypothetical protein MPSYJ_24770 [Mycolicibacterium psychrotolerans]|uniref:Uncharacterized protein n=1 Tax=Mycolicibacterium psychrotolerans TaxID=216929 RepID=A0A7I7MAF9_9MYCO|nr:hypothetical protein MPSYJ_24770 [Mycolicibacterium psychrotolerans]
MRRDPTATVTGIEVRVRPDGSVATIWRVWCPLCRGFHNHRPTGTRHLRQAPCTPCSGLHIEPPTPRIIERRNVIDQRPHTDPTRIAQQRRAAYIEACRTAGRDTALHEDRHDDALAGSPRP